jgi:predicted metalloenzyme YecM
VNGRPISTFLLKKPLVVRSSSDLLKLDHLRTVRMLEVPAPKPNKPYINGFEHIEAVTKVTLEDFLRFSQANNRNAGNSDLPMDFSNFSSALNRDVGVQFPSGLVKFHELPLDQVIEIEKSG